MFIFSIILFSFFVFISGGVIFENRTTVSLTERNLTTQKDVAGNLKTFFNKNLEEFRKTIRKVLEEFDSSLSGKIKLTNDSSIEEDLLQHQVIQEVKEMFTEMKRRILSHKQSHYEFFQIQNEVFLNDQPQNDSEKKKDSAMENIDSRNQHDSDTYPTNQNYSYISTDTTIRYRILVTSYNPKSSDVNSFRNVHNNSFSTIDVDNDIWEKSCSEKNKGGWWYYDCYYNNPTGIYGVESGKGIALKPFGSNIRYAKMLQLKIRPKVCGDHISKVQLNKHNCA
ncbi:UNVERIFIED_CONTAM: hypothetical protein RMT77_019264 [Armadillidium vulgare]